MDTSQAAGYGLHATRRAQRRETAAALGVALVALNALDLVITRFSIEGFAAIELNPLLTPLIGTPWVVALKLGLPIAVFAVATRVYRQRGIRWLRIGVAIYIVVVISGLAQLAIAAV